MCELRFRHRLSTPSLATATMPVLKTSHAVAIADLLVKPQYQGALVCANVCCMISFSILSSAHFSAPGWKTGYNDYTALTFTVGAGVMAWLFTLGVLGGIGAKLSGAVANLPMNVIQLVDFGMVVAFIFVYSAAVACSSISSDCDLFDDDNSIAKKENKFCEKLRASCTFIWFASGGFIVLLYLHWSAKQQAEKFAGSGSYEHARSFQPMAYPDPSAPPPQDGGNEKYAQPNSGELAVDVGADL